MTDDQVTEAILSLTAQVSRLATVVERNVEDTHDQGKSIESLRRWVYAMPASFVLSIGTILATVTSSIAS